MKYLCICLAALGLLAFSGCRAKTASDSDYVEKTYGMTAAETVTCQDVIDRKPVTPASSFLAQENKAKVFCFTKIICREPGKSIYHRYSVYKEGLDQAGIWMPVHTSELPVKLKEFRTWSYKTVYPGKWRVDVLAPDKKSIMSTAYFKVVRPD